MHFLFFFDNLNQDIRQKASDGLTRQKRFMRNVRKNFVLKSKEFRDKDAKRQRKRYYEMQELRKTSMSQRIHYREKQRETKRRYRVP